eukprot:gene10912-2986_t
MNTAKYRQPATLIFGCASIKASISITYPSPATTHTLGILLDTTRCATTHYLGLSRPQVILLRKHTTHRSRTADRATVHARIRVSIQREEDDQEVLVAGAAGVRSGAVIIYGSRAAGAGAA